MEAHSRPFRDETPFPEVSDDPFAGLEPADPFAGLRATSTSPRHKVQHPERPTRAPRPARRGQRWRPGRGLIIGGLAGLFAVVLAVLGILYWPSIQDWLAGDDATTEVPVAATEPAPAAPSASSTDVEAALSAGGFDQVSVSVVDGRATLTGTVPDEAALAEVTSLVIAQEGVSSLDNQVLVESSTGLSTEQLTLAAEDALAAAGFARVTVAVENGVATLGGFVPITALEDGFFGYVQRAEATVTRIDGIDSVVSQIGIKGNAAQLRAQLTASVEANPIVFESGSAALSPESAAVLDEVATAIIGQPGLQVFIAGHTDTAGASETNEALARGRAGAVYQYLAQRGVPANRMFVVAYGELFPDAEDDAASRRIEFEVGG